jgi:hypothetical protein
MRAKRKGLGHATKQSPNPKVKPPEKEGFAMSLPASKHTRNADYRHAQSLGQQRKAAGTTTPREQAQVIASIVRKRVADGQPVPDLDRYNLTDATWSELLAILDGDELTAVGDAAGGDDTDDTANEPSLDEWTATRFDTHIILTRRCRRRETQTVCHPSE